MDGAESEGETLDGTAGSEAINRRLDDDRATPRPGDRCFLPKREAVRQAHAIRFRAAVTG